MIRAIRLKKTTILVAMVFCYLMPTAFARIEQVFTSNNQSLVDVSNIVVSHRKENIFFDKLWNDLELALSEYFTIVYWNEGLAKVYDRPCKNGENAEFLTVKQSKQLFKLKNYKKVILEKSTSFDEAYKSLDRIAGHPVILICVNNSLPDLHFEIQRGGVVFEAFFEAYQYSFYAQNASYAKAVKRNKMESPVLFVERELASVIAMIVDDMALAQREKSGSPAIYFKNRTQFTRYSQIASLPWMSEFIMSLVRGLIDDSSEVTVEHSKWFTIEENYNRIWKEILLPQMTS
ncbi:MAG: hypothetical protein KDD48_06000, partial [Bdellovibrionales bacterium]|nr:hypothetical protein [Bdellovibrionales bacterium]